MGNLRSRRSWLALLGFSLAAAAAVAAGPDAVPARVSTDFGTFAGHFPELASPLDNSDFRHPAEIDMINTLMTANPGIRDMMDEVKERQIRAAKDKDQLYQLQAVQCSASQFPHIFKAATEAASALGLHNNFKVFVVNNAEIQDDIAGFTRHAHYGNSFSNYSILLTSGMVKAMSADELKFIIGREMGHVKANHRFYTALAFEYQAKTGMIPKLFPEQKQIPSEGFGGAITMFFGIAPACSRLSEFTSDRAGAVAVGKRETGLNALSKIAQGDMENRDGFDLNSFLKQTEEATKDLTPKQLDELVAGQMFQPYTLMRVGELNRFALSEQFKLLVDRTTTNPFLMEAEMLWSLGSSLRQYSARLAAFEKDPQTARLDPLQRDKATKEFTAKIDARTKAVAELEGLVLAHVNSAGLAVNNSMFDDLLNTARRRADAKPFTSTLTKLAEQVQFALTQPGVTEEQRQKLEAKKAAIEEVKKLAPADRPVRRGPAAYWIEQADLPQLLNNSVATLSAAASEDSREAFFAKLDELKPQLKELAVKTLASFPAEQKAQLALMISSQSGQLAQLVGEVQAAGTDSAALGEVFEKNFIKAKGFLKTTPLFLIRKALARFAKSDV